MWTENVFLADVKRTQLIMYKNFWPPCTAKKLSENCGTPHYMNDIALLYDSVDAATPSPSPPRTTPTWRTWTACVRRRCTTSCQSPLSTPAPRRHPRPAGARRDSPSSTEAPAWGGRGALSPVSFYCLQTSHDHTAFNCQNSHPRGRRCRVSFFYSFVFFLICSNVSFSNSFLFHLETLFWPATWIYLIFSSLFGQLLRVCMNITWLLLPYD